MPTTNFSDLALLWPFANQLDQTIFIDTEREKHQQLDVPPNDGLANNILSIALGHITMDDSICDYYRVGYRDDEYKEKMNCRHLIFVGGPIRNYLVKNLFDKFDKNEVIKAANLPFKADRPRSMKIVSSGVTEYLPTDYYDSPENQHIKTDYGLALLANNPFANDSSFKVLLVAGLHSYGTLAAAKFVSDPILSAEISQAFIAKYHTPPHLLGTIEVVIRVDIENNGNMRSLSIENIMSIYLNGNLIFQPDYFKTNQSKPEFRLKTVSRTDNRHTGSLIINYIDKIESSEVGTLITSTESNLVPDEFFDFFAKRAVFVISPHSDDSAISCGGLIYYLRNKKLWQFHSKDKCPTVNVLILTESVRGVRDYFGKYCFHIGLDKEAIDEDEVKIGKMKAEIRHSEGLAEARLLGTNPHWLNLKAEERYKDENIEKLFKVVGNILNESGKFIFDTDLVFQNDLDKSFVISKKIRQEFKNKGIILSQSAIVSTWKKGGRWIINDVDKIYTVKREEERLSVYTDCIPLFLIPKFGDQHPTHKYCTEIILELIRHYMPDRTELWEYDGPWSAFEPYDINFILSLDKHAMFAKLQAISMHQSQELRTRFTNVAWARSKSIAETLPETLFGFSGGSFGWEYLEVFSSRIWEQKKFAP